MNFAFDDMSYSGKQALQTFAQYNPNLPQLGHLKLPENSKKILIIPYITDAAMLYVKKEEAMGVELIQVPEQLVKLKEYLEDKTGTTKNIIVYQTKVPKQFGVQYAFFQHKFADYVSLGEYSTLLYEQIPEPYKNYGKES
jgi:hypothetical protein